MTVNLLTQNANVAPFDNKYQQSSVNRLIKSNSQPQKDSVNFLSQNKEKQYENPVNKNMEYFSASIVPIVTSLAVAAGAHILAETNKNKNAFIFGLGALMLTLPVALYKRSVSAFAKTKEMDVYSREKAAETTLSGKIDQKANDDNVKLDDAINSYTKFEIGRQGKAIGVVNT